MTEYGTFPLLRGEPPSLYRNDFQLKIIERRNVANSLSKQCLCNWRNVRDHAVRGVCLIFANNPKRLSSAVIPSKGHLPAEKDEVRLTSWLE
jgi:hypothetical protein